MSLIWLILPLSIQCMIGRLNFDNIQIHPPAAPPVLHPPSPNLPLKVDSLQSISASAVYNHIENFNGAYELNDQMLFALIHSIEADSIKIQRLLELTRDFNKKLEITRNFRLKPKMPEVILSMFQKDPSDAFLQRLLRSDDLVNWNGLNTDRSSLELKGFYDLLSSRYLPYSLERALMRQAVQHLNLIATSSRIDEANQLFKLLLQKGTSGMIDHSYTFLILFSHNDLVDRQPTEALETILNDLLKNRPDMFMKVLKSSRKNGRLSDRNIRNAWISNTDAWRIILKNQKLFNQVDPEGLAFKLRALLREDTSSSNLKLLLSNNHFLQRVDIEVYLSAFKEAVRKHHEEMDGFMNLIIFNRIPRERLDAFMAEVAQIAPGASIRIFHRLSMLRREAQV